MKSKAILRVNTMVGANKYLNNLVEQDDRRVKQRLYPMPGLKRLENATITISGIELEQKIRERQFDTSSLEFIKERAPEVWEAVMGA